MDEVTIRIHMRNKLTTQHPYCPHPDLFTTTRFLCIETASVASPRPALGGASPPRQGSMGGLVLATMGPQPRDSNHGIPTNPGKVWESLGKFGKVWESLDPETVQETKNEQIAD